VRLYEEIIVLSLEKLIKNDGNHFQEIAGSEEKKSVKKVHFADEEQFIPLEENVLRLCQPLQDNKPNQQETDILRSMFLILRNCLKNLFGSRTEISNTQSFEENMRRLRQALQDNKPKQQATDIPPNKVQPPRFRNVALEPPVHHTRQRNRKFGH
jgi:hypothetical protein